MINWIISHLEELSYVATVFAGMAAVIGLVIWCITIYYWKKNLDTMLKLREQDAKRNAYLITIDRAENFAKFLEKWWKEYPDIKKTKISQNVIIIFNSEKWTIETKTKNKELEMNEESLNTIGQKILLFANELEAFAMPFWCWAASIEMWFMPLWESYCEIVEEIFKFFPLFARKWRSYVNMLSLYMLWKQKILKNNAELQLKKATTAYENIPDIRLDKQKFV